MEYTLTRKSICYLTKKWFGEVITLEQAHKIGLLINESIGEYDLVDESLICDCICEVLEIN